jgi:hypothetical protein
MLAAGYRKLLDLSFTTDKQKINATQHAYFHSVAGGCFVWKPR